MPVPDANIKLRLAKGSPLTPGELDGNFTAIITFSNGLETRMNVPAGDGKRWIEVAPPGAVTTIALVAEKANQPTGHDTGIRLATADADAKHADLLSRGVDADEVLRWPGVPAMFAFRDPDGNTLEIVEGP